MIKEICQSCFIEKKPGKVLCTFHVTRKRKFLLIPLGYETITFYICKKCIKEESEFDLMPLGWSEL